MIESPIFKSSKAQKLKQPPIWTQNLEQRPNRVSHKYALTLDKLTKLEGYLTLQKYMQKLIRSLKKQIFKVQRTSFNRIRQYEKNRKDKQFSHLHLHQEKIQKSNISVQSISYICMKEVENKLDKFYWVLTSKKNELIMLAWARLKSDNPICEQTPCIYSKAASKLTGNASRLSNKRKSGKHKQVHAQQDELWIENQSLRQQILDEEAEKEGFMEQLHDLLDHHQKFLTQSCVTSRGKKKR